MRFRHSQGVSRSSNVVEDERSRSARQGTGASSIPMDVVGAVGMGDDVELFGEVAGDVTRRDSCREVEGDERIAAGNAETRWHRRRNEEERAGHGDGGRRRDRLDGYEGGSSR